ncbi:MAG: hypothetical protein LBM69_03975, partial [Lachnospiraceae bacterium]|nr:hypothetical protein [Lachnospiraceae bacterium]
MHSLVRSAVKLECLSDTFLQTYDKIAPLFLYGAGNSVYFAMDFTRKHGVNVLGIIDSNAEKQGCLL